MEMREFDHDRPPVAPCRTPPNAVLKAVLTAVLTAVLDGVLNAARTPC